MNHEERQVTCLRTVLVGRAECPFCRSMLLVHELVRPNGYCPECRRYVVPRGTRIGMVDGAARDRPIERERRAARHRRLRPRGLSAVISAIGSATEAGTRELLRQFEQFELFDDSEGR